GAVVALPFCLRARRRAVRLRAAALTRARRRAPRGGVRARIGRLASARIIRTVRRVLNAPRRRRAARRRDDELARELAIVVDLVGVGVSAGCTPYTAVELAARWSPSRMRRALEDVIRSCRLGQSFDDGLRELGLTLAP